MNLNLKKYIKRLFIQIKQLKTAFAPRGLLLSSAVTINPAAVSQGYNVSSIARDLDFINLITAGFNTPFDNVQNLVTNHFAPLYGRGQCNNCSIDAAVKYWINAGAPSWKLILGISTYATNYIISSDNSSLGAPSDGPDQIGNVKFYYIIL
jgi:chitinase